MSRTAVWLAWLVLSESCSYGPELTIVEDPERTPGDKVAAVRGVVFQFEGDLRILDVESGKECFLERAASSESHCTCAMRWSPDGSRLAYVTSPGNDGRGNLAVYDARNGRISTLTLSNGERVNAEDTHLCWSPSGRELLCEVPVWTGNGANFQIYRIDLDTRKARALTFGRWRTSTQPDWSAKRHEIVYQQCGSLYVVRPDGSDRRMAVEGSQYAHPRWSPNGKWLCYIEERPSYEPPSVPDSKRVERLWILDMDRREPIEMHRAPRISPASWSPDSAHLSFRTWEADGSWQYVRDIGGGPSERIARAPVDITEMALPIHGQPPVMFAILDKTSSYCPWSPDGRRLIVRGCKEGAPDSGMYLIDLETRAAKLIDSRARTCEWPHERP